MNIRFHRRAVAEIDHEVVDYHEARQVGLGEELEDEIDAVLTMIRRSPEAAPQWKHRRDRRVVVLDRFPFDSRSRCRIVLAHTSRRPGYWARRRQGLHHGSR